MPTLRGQLDCLQPSFNCIANGIASNMRRDSVLCVMSVMPQTWQWLGNARPSWEMKRDEPCEVENRVLTNIAAIGVEQEAISGAICRKTVYYAG